MTEQMKQVYGDIAKRLRAERLFLGYTQEQMAEFLDISLRHYGRYESGKYAIPYENLYKLEPYGFDACYLLEGRVRTDRIVEKGLEVVPDELLFGLLDMFGKCDENSEYIPVPPEDIDIALAKEKLIEIARYVCDHPDAPRLREVPAFNVGTMDHEEAIDTPAK